jgi:hypothetical protein
VISITVRSPEWKYIEYTQCRLISINMWTNWLWVCAWKVFQLYLWLSRYGRIVLLTTRFINVAKCTILTQLSLLYWCIHSFKNVVLKLISIPNFCLKIWENLRVLFGRAIKHDQILKKKSFLWIITFLLSGCMHIQNNDILPATSQRYILHPVATKLYCLNWWYSSLL